MCRNWIHLRIAFHGGISALIICSECEFIHYSKLNFPKIGQLPFQSVNFVLLMDTTPQILVKLWFITALCLSGSPLHSKQHLSRSQIDCSNVLSPLRITQTQQGKYTAGTWFASGSRFARS